MALYLVAYCATEKNVATTKWGCLGQFLMGRVMHVELAFRVDTDNLTGLVMTTMCPDGYPLLVYPRSYDDHQGEYDIEFYEFKGLKYHTIRRILRSAQKVVSARSHRMSVAEMLSSTFPRVFKFLYQWSIRHLYYKKQLKYEMEYPPPSVPTYCVSLISEVLSEHLAVPSPFRVNASDFVRYCISSGLVEKAKERPDVCRVTMRLRDQMMEARAVYVGYL